MAASSSAWESQTGRAARLGVCQTSTTSNHEGEGSLEYSPSWGCRVGLRAELNKNNSLKTTVIEGLLRKKIKMKNSPFATSSIFLTAETTTFLSFLDHSVSLPYTHQRSRASRLPTPRRLCFISFWLLTQNADLDPFFLCPTQTHALFHLLHPSNLCKDCSPSFIYIFVLTFWETVRLSLPTS